LVEAETLSIESDLWVCPVCHGALADSAHDRGGQACACAKCSLTFPIVEGMPVLVRSSACHLEEMQRSIRENPAWYESAQLEWYDRGPCRHHLAQRRRYVEGVLREWLAPSGRAKRLLDLGCGDGANARWLVHFTERLEGCDYNLLRLKRCRNLLGNKIQLCLADVHELPYPDDAFDVVFFNHVLEHIRDDIAALRSVRRVLRPGGLLVLGVPNAGCACMRLAYRLQPKLVANSDHVQSYTAPLIEERCREAGLEVRETHHIGWGPPHLKLDEFLRQHRWVDRLFEVVGRSLFRRQSTSLYLLLTKSGPDSGGAAPSQGG
jgi:ubiquinone/menaquinone biosynthesis C-methylase UbiE/uncharacterized protein YbaR (Trm112 family)